MAAGAVAGLDNRKSIYHTSTVTRRNIRTSPLPAASLHVVLALLDGELHGYAVMQRVGELSGGAVKMGPGTLYGTLNRLVEDGLVVETTNRSKRHDNERRRYYELSANGRAVAVAELGRLQTLIDRVSSKVGEALA